MLEGVGPIRSWKGVMRELRKSGGGGREFDKITGKKCYKRIKCI